MDDQNPSRGDAAEVNMENRNDNHSNPTKSSKWRQLSGCAIPQKLTKTQEKESDEANKRQCNVNVASAGTHHTRSSEKVKFQEDGQDMEMELHSVEADHQFLNDGEVPEDDSQIEEPVDEEGRELINSSDSSQDSSSTNSSDSEDGSTTQSQSHSEPKHMPTKHKKRKSGSAKRRSMEQKIDSLSSTLIEMKKLMAQKGITAQQEVDRPSTSTKHHKSKKSKRDNHVNDLATNTES